MGLPTLSASKLKTYALCPYKYKYTYIDRLPQDKHPAAALGTAVHETIDGIYKQRQDPVSLFVQQFDKQWYDFNLPTDSGLYSRYLSDGIIMVGDYDYTARVPINTEVEFRLKFPNDAHAICIIHGFIDQMYDWGFVDLKTNGRKPKQEDLDNDLQFILYQWAFRLITGSQPTQSVWYHLRTQEDIIADVVGKDDVAERAIVTILETKEYIKNRGPHCRWCPFKEPCFAEDMQE